MFFRLIQAQSRRWRYKKTRDEFNAHNCWKIYEREQRKIAPRSKYHTQIVTKPSRKRKIAFRHTARFKSPLCALDQESWMGRILFIHRRPSLVRFLVLNIPSAWHYCFDAVIEHLLFDNRKKISFNFACSLIKVPPIVCRRLFSEYLWIFRESLPSPL